MKLLSGSIHLDVTHNLWNPIKFKAHSPPLSRLFFIDDIILTGRITPSSCKSSWDHIDLFISYSGQSINLFKSRIFFSKSTSLTDKALAFGHFNIHEGTCFGKYLGFSIAQGLLKACDCHFLLDSVQLHLTGWETNHLSLAGRLTLIQTTLNAIPNHVMQFIKLLAEVINNLKYCGRNVLWGFTSQNQKLYPLA